MATGAGSLQEAGLQQWGEKQHRTQSCPLTQWDRELFPPCLPKSLLVNGTMFLSVRVHAKNTVKCMVRWPGDLGSISNTLFENELARDESRVLALLTRFNLFFHGPLKSFWAEAFKCNMLRRKFKGTYG